MDAAKLEMKNVMVELEDYDRNPDELVGYTDITGHLVFFNINLSKNFKQNPRYCADGNKIDTQSSLTYSTVVFW